MDHSHRRKTDKRLVLEALTEAAGPPTTLQLSQRLGLELHRCAGVVGQLVEEHQLEHAVRKEDGWSWALTDVGRAELGRQIAAETGELYDSGRDPDESALAANLARRRAV